MKAETSALRRASTQLAGWPSGAPAGAVQALLPPAWVGIVSGAGAWATGDKGQCSQMEVGMETREEATSFIFLLSSF